MFVKRYFYHRVLNPFPRGGVLDKRYFYHRVLNPFPRGGVLDDTVSLPISPKLVHLSSGMVFLELTVCGRASFNKQMSQCTVIVLA